MPEPATQSVHVHLVQPDVVWHDIPANLDRVGRMLEEHPPAPGSIVVVPETFASGFTHEVDVADDSADRLGIQFLESLCRKYACYAIGGLVTRDAVSQAGLNQAVCVGPEGEIGRYAKANLFPLSREVESFTAGEQAERFDLAQANVCPLICYDLRFPETWRLGVGADLFVLIANWPASRMHHWHALLRARAIENQAFVVGVNRTGVDPFVQYSGGSVVYDHDGHCLSEMDERPAVRSVELDLEAMRKLRNKLPFLPGAKRARPVEPVA